MRAKVLAVVACTVLVAGIALAQQAAPTVVKVTFRDGSTAQGELVELVLGGTAEAFLAGPSLVGKTLCIQTAEGRKDVPADKLLELDIEWEQGEGQQWRMKQVRAVFLDAQGRKKEVVGTLRGAELPGSTVKLRVQGQEVVLSANLQDRDQPINPSLLITKVEFLSAAPPPAPAAEEKPAPKEAPKPAAEAPKAKKPMPMRMQASGVGTAALEITVTCPHCGKAMRIVVTLKPEVVQVKMAGQKKGKGAEVAEGEKAEAQPAEGAAAGAGGAAGAEQAEGGK